jgi:predicted ATPase/serine/threonine protein kinase
MGQQRAIKVTPERWRQVDRVFQAALNRGRGERAAFLDQVCEGDEELRREVESLLSSYKQASTLVEAPVSEAVGELVSEEHTASSFSSPTDRQGLYVGMVLNGRYVVEKELGHGGVGAVYLARDNQLLFKPVVVKILLDQARQNDWILIKFKQEIEALTRVEHPGVVTVLDAGKTPDGKPYLVMQYVDGVPLRSVLRPEGMDLTRTAEIMRQIGQALDAAHDQGVLHRDLKPENIMVKILDDGREQIKLIDFGIAKIKDSVVAPTTAIEMVAGTVAYMAPEQLSARPVSTASDVYALGVIAYEMVAGRRPFNPDSMFQLLEMQRNGVKVKPKDLRPTLPEVAQGVILKALSFDPKDRYQRAREFGDEVARALNADAEMPRPIVRQRMEEPRRSNLPAPLTSLIGREQEMTSAIDRLRRKELRMLSLTGPGGIGKTRLAQQVAAELLDEFGDGVSFVSLAPIISPDLVAPAIAKALGVEESGATPLVERLQDYLGSKHLLLLIDNFEHVISAAPLVTDLLASSPKLKVLVTSRAVLNLSGEHEFPVPPLALPDPKRLPPIKALSRYGAVELFTQRALEVKPDFVLTTENARTVAEICTRLDGLPLAIELAAARVKLLPPQMILLRLESRLKTLTGGARDLPERQQTIRGAIGWSYDLLEESEKRLFIRLSVFVGGCTPEAAADLCDGEGGFAADILDGLSALVDKSLLHHEEQARGIPRFVMLETIREYGVERLAAVGETELMRRRHAAFFLALVERVEAELTGSKQEVFLEELEKEHGNVRAALSWARESGEAEVGLRIAGALWRFWQVRSHLSEGRGWVEGFLSAIEDGGASAPVRAKALNVAGALAGNQGDYERENELLRESLTLYRQLGDKRGMANSHNTLGNVAYAQGNYEMAARLFAEALARRKELGDRWGVAASLNNLAAVAHDRGDYGEAAALHKKSLLIKRELGDRRGLAFSLHNLGEVAQHQGDYGRAKEFLEESLAIQRELGDKVGVAFALNNLGNMALIRGDYECAAELCKEGLVFIQEVGDKRGIAQSLEGLANVACAQGDYERTTRLYGAAEAMRVAIGVPLPRPEQEDFNRNLAAARERLGSEKFSALWTYGRSLTAEKAVAEALK